MSYIYSFFGSILRFFYDITGGYAGALLLFTLAVKILMLPLAIKQQKNTLQQVRLKPKEQLIRKRYSYDQKLLQEKLQEFYNKEGYNPMGGCLPLVIQLPIIFILYRIVESPLQYIAGVSADAIKTAAEALGVQNYNYDINVLMALNKQSEVVLEGYNGLNFSLFGFLDLAQQPSITSFGWVLLIPLLAAATGFLQTFVSRAATKYTAAADQANGCSMKALTFSGPLISLVFAFSFPAGVGFYWILNNLIGSLQTFLLNKFMSPEKAMAEAEDKLKAQVEQRRARKAAEAQSRSEDIMQRELDRKNAARKASGLRPLNSLGEEEPVEETEEEQNND